MNAVTQTMQPGAAAPYNTEDSMPLMLSFSPNWPIRTVMFRIAGTAMVFSASGMWLMPGSAVNSELMLFKLGVSIFFFFCGLALLMRNHSDARPDAYFDPIRSEVRVLQKNDRGRPQTVLRRTYESLGSAEFTDNSVVLYDVDGSALMRLLVDDAKVRHSLRSQLNGLVTVKA